MADQVTSHAIGSKPPSLAMIVVCLITTLQGHVTRWGRIWVHSALDQSLLVSLSGDLDHPLPLAESLEWTLTLTLWVWAPDIHSQFSCFD